MGMFKGETSEKVDEYHALFKAPEARILAVDDNQINLTIVKGLLRRTEIQIDTASNGFDCLDMVKSKQYHIIFLDHMMPDIDGIEVMKRLKAMSDNMSKDAPVIALTANAIAGAKEEYLAHGFTDYMAKPIDAKELEKMLTSYRRILQPFS